MKHKDKSKEITDHIYLRKREERGEKERKKEER